MFYLERAVHPGSPADRLRLSPMPFRIGRSAANELQVDLPAVSKAHAVFMERDGCCWVRDLNSTNGTFVNGSRITECALADGDVLQLGPVELRFRSSQAPVLPAAFATQALPMGVGTSAFHVSAAVRQLITREAVSVVFQPILNLQSRQVAGYEALGRGDHPTLARTPTDLFRQADTCGLSVELSQCLRRVALASARDLPRHLPLFLNVHPHELTDPSFLPSIERLQNANHLRRPLVVEIAEASVASVGQMRVIARGLVSNMVRFAYDDFGVGQARLLDITDVPPHFLKLDRSLVAGIDTVAARRDVISALARVVRPACVQVIAEGIESETVAACCAEAGCDLGQGFLWGVPDDPAPGREVETKPSTTAIVR